VDDSSNVKKVGSGNKSMPDFVKNMGGADKFSAPSFGFYWAFCCSQQSTSVFARFTRFSSTTPWIKSIWKYAVI